MYKLYLVCEVARTMTLEGALDKLDAFREAVIPSQNYGITLYQDQGREVLRKALDNAISRAERIEKAGRSIASEADGIQCAENDMRRDMGLPPKEE